MIRINLLPVPKKRKTKPLPAFITTAIAITVFVFAILSYLIFYYSSQLRDSTMRFAANNHKIEELKQKIKEVEHIEKLNKTVEERTKVIEYLRKKQNMPVMILDEVNRNLPNGVWLNSMTSSDKSINIDGYAFTNSDVVAYVNNLKASTLFSDIYLQESKQAEMEKIPVYQFKLTFNVKV